MLKKAAVGIWEIMREDGGTLAINIYSGKKDASGNNLKDSSGNLIPVSDFHGFTGHPVQDFYDALVYLFPELVKDAKLDDPTDFDERVAAAIKRLAETDKDLIERIKNYTDGEDVS